MTSSQERTVAMMRERYGLSEAQVAQCAYLMELGLELAWADDRLTYVQRIMAHSDEPVEGRVVCMMGRFTEFGPIVAFLVTEDGHVRQVDNDHAFEKLAVWRDDLLRPEVT